MPRKPSSQATEVELQILRILWEQSPATARQIHNRLAAVDAVAAFLLRGRSANSRYVLGCTAILAMPGLPMGTFALLSQDAPPAIDEASITPAVYQEGFSPHRFSVFPVIYPSRLRPLL